MNTEEALKRKERETPRDRELCSYGFKFEQYMSVSRPGAAHSEAVTCQPVNENTEFCCIFRTRLGQVNPMISVSNPYLPDLDPEPGFLRPKKFYLDLPTKDFKDQEKKSSRGLP